MQGSDFTYLVLVAAILVAVGLAIRHLRRRRPAPTAEDLYTAGLNYLLAGEQNKALEAFRRCVAQNTSNVDAYLRIGDILRQKGQVSRAIKIHRELTIRTGLSKDQQVAIHRSLAEDYLAAGDREKAIAVLLRTLELQRENPWAVQKLVRIYEDLGDWKKAAEWREKLRQLQGADQSAILALYKVEEGRENVRAGKERAARVRFREAIKLDPTCAPAYLELADSYIREGRERDSLRVLRMFIHRAPKQAYLAFSRIENVLFSVGQFGEVENILEELISAHPDAVRARLALARILEKKGEVDRAIQLCEEALEREPDSLSVRSQLIRLYLRRGDTDVATKLVVEVADMADRRDGQFACGECGFLSPDYFWRCPKCGAWQGAFERL
ncbi:MAG: tetratricopeptide repeat protein [candidate division KSB1 bacterium]|nr:tetratricopeptide repeat protein [candidate division KSB1 bacterium]